MLFCFAIIVSDPKLGRAGILHLLASLHGDGDGLGECGGTVTDLNSVTGKWETHQKFDNGTRSYMLYLLSFIAFYFIT